MTRIGLGGHRAARWRAAIGARWRQIAQVAVPQLLALAAAGIVYALAAPRAAGADAWVSAILATAFAGLRIAAVRTDLVPSTYALDAAGVAVFIGGTGHAASPFIPIALAGAWWAAHRAGRGTLYGVAFVICYAILVAPSAMRDGAIASAVYQPAFVATIGILADRLRAKYPSRWAPPLDAGARSAGLPPESVRVGLSRAIRGGVVPIDVLLTAGQLGLTAIQTELIAYLILGLSNMEIAEALSVSEATVRYRLTRLYRVLDVRGRKAAAERARELGLDALVGAGGPEPVAQPPPTAPN